MSTLGTILWLRRRMAIRELSGLAGAVNLAGGVALMIAAALGALAVATGLGVVMAMAVGSGNAEAFTIAWSLTLHTVAFFALVVPIVVGAGDTSFDPSRLLRFPLSRRRLYHLSMASDFVSKVHLAWYPTIVVTLVAGVLIPGPNRIGPVMAVLLFVATMVVWSHTLLLVVRRVLRNRRLREIATIIGFAAVLVVAFLPASIDLDTDDADRQLDEFLTLPDWVRSGSAVFPPSIATRLLVEWRANRAPSDLIELLWLIMWLASGWFAGERAFGQLLNIGGSSVGGSSTRSSSGSGILGTVFDRLPSTTGALATKELRYLFQSGVGRVSLVVMPLLTALTATLSARHAESLFFGFAIESAVFLGIMIYAAALMGYVQVNTFAWESSGFVSYFTSPARPREIVLGKNIGTWSFVLIFAIEGLLVWSVICGLPHPAVAATGLIVFATTIVLLSVIGNFTSIAFPVARPIASVTSASSPVGTFVMIGCLLVGVVVAAIATLGSGLSGSPGLQPTVALISLVLVLAVYRWSLAPASVALSDRREEVARSLNSG